jgi:hypothetical protein
MNQAEFFIPNEAFIKKLKVSSLAPHSFGKWSKVVEIICQKDDINGVPFVHYYVEFGNDGSKISNSLKADELNRTVKLSQYYKSLELDDIEAEMKKSDIELMSLEEYKDRYNESWHRPVEEYKY